MQIAARKLGLELAPTVRGAAHLDTVQGLIVVESLDGLSVGDPGALGANDLV